MIDMRAQLPHVLWNFWKEQTNSHSIQTHSTNLTMNSEIKLKLLAPNCVKIFSALGTRALFYPSNHTVINKGMSIITSALLSKFKD